MDKQILFYNYNYSYFNDILSLKMNVRDGALSVYENLFSRLYGVGAIDRTNKLPKSLNTKSISPIPSYLEDIPSYDDIALESATKIKDGLFLQPMFYYDGTIDATVALLAVLEVGTENVIVKVSNAVYDKQKTFLDNLEVEIDLSDEHGYSEDIKHFNIISHSLGKLVNDCDYAFNVTNDFNQLNSGKEDFTPFLESMLLTDRNIDTLHEQIKAIEELSPVELTSLYSLIYWSAFNLAWQGLRFNGYSSIIFIERASKTVKDFYNTDKFQRYALKQFNKVISKDNFKQDAKDFISLRNDDYIFVDDLSAHEFGSQTSRLIFDDYKPFRDLGLF